MSFPEFLIPPKPTGAIIQPDGCYGSSRRLGDTPHTCPECKGPHWTLHRPFPYNTLEVCSGCFRYVKEHGGLSKK
ncbi:hypothetical protein Indivirus_11_13 [Indivirus ILV1]|uniref:Uncharacterized protein n=1 Tax=Indivirus ILV1 TaxID=1977633 RepID=A0A1V0SEB3_9VIRU|nr:hypothetical protein Indivirus_11_13 [Indivirus ILV1]